MNKTTIYGIIICLLVSGGLYYWYLQTKPSQSEIELAMVKIDSINPNLMTGSTVKSLKELNKNGDIPVATQGKTIGKTNPFQ